MRVSFDFDKVFVNTPPFIPTIVIEWLYKKDSFNLTYRYPGKLEQYARVFFHNILFRPPIQNNLSELPQISKVKSLELFIISGRFGFLKNQTHRWITRYNLRQYFKSLHFNYNNEQPHIFKDEMVKKIKIHKHVDDDLDLLRFLAKKNPRVEFYWLHNTTRIDEVRLPENISPIKNLEEFRVFHLGGVPSGHHPR